MQADLLTKVILPLALFVIMFGMGLSLKFKDFKDVFKSPKALSVGLVGQLILLPLMAFVIAVVLGLSAEIAVGLMVIALAPGGATSNMFTYLSKGDASLSISLTALVSLVTPFTIPIVIAFSMTYFMGSMSEFQLPILKTIMQLLVITIVPVSLGMFCLSRWPTFSNKTERVLKTFSIFFLALIVVLIVLKNKDNMISFFIQAGFATLALNLLALFIGYQLAKLTKLPNAQVSCITFEVGIQNGTLALLVAGTLIGNETMMIPAVTYSILMFVTGSVFARWFSQKN